MKKKELYVINDLPKKLFILSNNVTVTYLKMKKTKNSKSFFGYKTKEKRKNEKIGYAISILL